MVLTEVEKVMVKVGDLSSPPILDEDVYKYLLAENNGSVNRASVQAAQTILFFLAKMPVRERTGDIEVWKNWAKEYKEALLLYIKEAALSNYAPIAYAGGISKSDSLANDQNNDNVQRDVYRGVSTGERKYNQTYNDTCDDVSHFFIDGDQRDHRDH